MIIDFKAERDMTIILTNPVTDNIKLDVRVTIRNEDSRSASCRIIIYWDEISVALLISEMVISIYPNKLSCFMFSVLPKGKRGRHKIIACVYDCDSIISKGEKRPLGISCYEDKLVENPVRGGYPIIL